MKLKLILSEEDCDLILNALETHYYHLADEYGTKSEMNKLSKLEESLHAQRKSHKQD